MDKSIDVFKCMLIKESSFVYESEISCPEDIVSAACALGYDSFSEEHMGMFCFNAKGKIIGYHEISHGGLIETMVHPREVFKRALLNNAAAIALVHNHPSGVCEPSSIDVKTTNILVEAGELLQIKVLDHIIVGHSKDDYASLNSMDLM